MEETAFWENLPRSDDTDHVEVGKEFKLGFATRMIEPQRFDFYADWLREQGWRQQAPTEAGEWKTEGLKCTSVLLF